MTVQGQDEEGEELWHDVAEEETPDTQEEVTLSVHAMEGKFGAETVRVIERHKNRKLIILIDSGSTHSFMDTRVAEELKIPVVEMAAMPVTVADGRKTLSNSMTPAFKWKIHQHAFMFNFRLLEMGSFDVILRVNWMTSFNPILFDFEDSSVSFKYQGKEITMRVVKGVMPFTKLLQCHSL